MGCLSLLCLCAVLPLIDESVMSVSLALRYEDENENEREERDADAGIEGCEELASDSSNEASESGRRECAKLTKAFDEAQCARPLRICGGIDNVVLDGYAEGRVCACLKKYHSGKE